MFKWIGGLFDRLCAVVGCLLFLQLPLFMQQYQQELKGHVAELEWQVSLITNAAQLSGKTLDQYIHKFMTSGDIDFARQGEILSAMVVRWNALSNSLNALNHASVWERPYFFFSTFNYEIVKSSLETFQVGIPLTLEALVYGLLGMLLGYALYRVFSVILSKIGRKISCAVT